MSGFSVKVSTAFTPRALMGGSRSETFNSTSLTRAKTDGRPKVRSQHKYKGDEILTRRGNKGAQVLARMQKAKPGPSYSQKKDVPKSIAHVRVRSSTNPSDGVKPQSQTLPVEELPRTAMQRIADSVNHCKTTLAKLSSDAQSDELLTPSERRQAEIDTEVMRGEVRVTADMTLVEIGKTLGEKTKALTDLVAKSGPTADGVKELESEIASLKSDRTTLIDMQIKSELGPFGAAVDRHISGSGISSTLLAIHGPGLQSQDPLIDQEMIKDIARGIEAANSGKASFTTERGTEIGLADFARTVSKLADDIQWAQDSDLGYDAHNALTKLASDLNVKAEYQKALKSFESLLDKAPTLSIGGAVMALSLALPGLRQDSEKTDADSLKLTSQNLATLADMVKKGNIFPNMLGHDPSFDLAVRQLQGERGSALAVEHLKTRLARAGNDWPSNRTFANADQRGKDLHARLKRESQANGREFRSLDNDLIQLAYKPENELSLDERVTLLDLTGQGRAGTFDEARAILLVANQIEVRERGEAAATSRHDATQMNIQLANILTADRRRLLKPWTWGDKSVKVLEHPLHGMPKDARLMETLRKFGNEATGRDVALLIAHIATFETRLLKAEQEAFGLYPNLDMAERTPDPKNPLAHLGISNRDLAKIGVQEDQLGEIDKVVQTLNKQGIGNVEDVRHFNEAINDVSKLVLKSELTQDMIRGYERENARMVGQHLAGELLSNAELAYRKDNNIRGMPDKRPTVGDPNVVSHFNTKVGNWKKAFDDETKGSWEALKTNAKACEQMETRIAHGYTFLKEIEENVTGYRAFLSAESGPTEPDLRNKLGINVDPNSPRGLRSAKLIRDALREQANIDGNVDVEGSAERLGRILEDLRGIDLETMRRPWYAKLAAAFKGGDKPDIETLRKYSDIADAIIYVREDGPTEMDRLTTNIEEYGAALNIAIDDRRQTNPKAMQQVTDLVRTTVLSEWRNYGDDKKAKGDFVAKNGQILEGFNPAIDPDRAKILKTLESWGLKGEDLERFSPEINSVLYSRMTADDIVQWAGETNWSSTAVDDYKSTTPPRFSRDGFVQTLGETWESFTDELLNRKVMDDYTKNSLLSMLESFQEGDKMDLKSGQRITLDSGKIPVEPTGLVGIKAKLAGSHLGQFEIERGSDGFKLHLRTGFAGKGNVDAIVGHNFDMGGGAQLTAQGSLGVEGGGSKLTGVTLSFKNDTDGCKSLVDLVGKMVDGEAIDLWDWKDATDVGSASETRAKIGLNAGLLGQAQIGGKGPELDSKNDTLGVGVTGQLTGSLTLGSKDNKTESLKETTRKGEVEYSVTLGASAAVYARIYNPLNIGTGFAATESGGQKGATDTFGTNDQGKSNYNITDNVQNTDLANIGISQAVTYTDKWKQVTDKNGLFTKCENVRQANFRQGIWQGYAVCDTPQMQTVLKQDKEFAANFKSFMDLTGPDDFIAVTYSIKEDKLKLSNDLLSRSQAAARNGDAKLSETLAGRARNIVNDDKNYIPSKIGLLTTSVRSGEIVNLNARWISWSTFSDGKLEHTGATLAIPKPTPK